MSSGIYNIVNSIDGTMYIGSALDIKERWHKHYTSLRMNLHKNPYLQNASNKYGRDIFKFSILEIVEEPKGLIPQEQYWIDYAKGLGIKLYNIAQIAGSNLGRIFGKRSPEVGKKISLATRGNKNKLNFRKQFCKRGHNRINNSYSDGACKTCVTLRNHGEL